MNLMVLLLNAAVALHLADAYGPGWFLSRCCGC